jgi:membrane-associated phospholipid phosphatase
LVLFRSDHPLVTGDRIKATFYYLRRTIFRYAMDRRSVTLLVLLFAGSVALSLAAWCFGVFSFDLEVARWVRGISHPLVTTAMKATSYAGDGMIPVLLVTVAATVCALKRKWAEAVFVVATLSSVMLAGVLKVLVGRHRPPAFELNVCDLVPPVSQYAYPSGHVLFFVVFFGFVAYLSWKFLTGRIRVFSLILCTALIVVIGPSRVVLGMHWVSDVTGSYIIGTFWLFSLIMLYQTALRMQTQETGNG